MHRTNSKCHHGLAVMGMVVSLFVGTVGCSGGASQPTVMDHPRPNPSMMVDRLIQTRDRKPIQGFEWGFLADTFEIRGEGIPSDLLEAFGAEGGVTGRRTIRGKWIVAGHEVRFSELQVDSKPSDRDEVVMPCYAAGSVCIESPSAIYRF